MEQKDYRPDRDEKASLKPTDALDDFIYIERPPLTTSAAERLATKGYLELIPERHGLYGVLSFRPEFMKIILEGVENSVTTNRATRNTQEGNALD